jgi:hypothetical protein
MLKHFGKMHNSSASKTYKIFICAPLSNQPENVFVKPEDQIKVTLINILDKNQSITSIMPDELDNM